MQVEKKPNYTLLSSDEGNFLDFYNSFLKLESNLIKNHIIIQISENLNTTEKDLLLFLDKAISKKENGTSFVIISSNVNIDNFPENFNIVPTLIEAEDIIEMEAIERELGF